MMSPPSLVRSSSLGQWTSWSGGELRRRPDRVRYSQYFRRRILLRSFPVLSSGNAPYDDRRAFERVDLEW